MVKTISWIQHKKNNKSRKNNEKDGETLFKLMNHSTYGKTMENVRNRIEVKLVNNEKDYLVCTPKPSHMSHKIFDNNLAAIRKTDTLTNQHTLKCAY